MMKRLVLYEISRRLPKLIQSGADQRYILCTVIVQVVMHKLGLRYGAWGCTSMSAMGLVE